MLVYLLYSFTVFLKKDAFPGRHQEGADPLELLNCCQNYVNRVRGFRLERVCLCRRWLCSVLLSREDSREDSSWKRKHTCSRVKKESHSTHSCRTGPSSKYCYLQSGTPLQRQIFRHLKQGLRERIRS
jgi:hypothetical protein